MIRKRYHFLLLAVPAAVGVLGVCIVTVVSLNDEESRFRRIREGMSREEVIGVIGRPPDRWIARDLGVNLRFNVRRGAPWPPPPEAGVAHLGWNLNASRLVWAWFDDAGRVSATGPANDTYKCPPTFWERLRRRLCL